MPGDGENNWSRAKIMTINCPLLAARSVFSFSPFWPFVRILYLAALKLLWNIWKKNWLPFLWSPLLDYILPPPCTQFFTPTFIFPISLFTFNFTIFLHTFSTWVKPMLCSNTHYSLSFLTLHFFNWSCRIFVSRMTTKKIQTKHTHTKKRRKMYAMVKTCSFSLQLQP